MVAAMARAMYHTKMGPALTWSTCFVFFMILLATMSLQPALIQAEDPTFELFFIGPASILVTAEPKNGSEVLAVTTVFTNVANASPDLESPKIGQVLGESAQYVAMPIDYRFFLWTNIIYTSKYTGTLQVQGVLSLMGNGELAIVGGTGDFRKAGGYVKMQVRVDNVFLKASYFVSFDCR